MQRNYWSILQAIGPIRRPRLNCRVKGPGNAFEMEHGLKNWASNCYFEPS